MSKDAPLAVEVPASGRDNPGWIKVGVIAAVGFIVGIAWPRVMGVRLGPASPGESAAAAASASASHGGRAPEAPPASIVAKGPAATAPAASFAPATSSASTASAAPPAPPNISVQRSTVLSCKTADGETKKGKECGPVPGIDQIVNPRVRKIASCAGAEGQTGKLSLVVNADFGTGRLWFDIGKSSTLPNVDAVAACLKTSFHGTSTTATTHEHPRYTVAYTAVFAPAVGAATDEDNVTARKDKGDKPDGKDKSDRSAKEASDEKKEEKTERSDLASGDAQVAWEVALVRDAPKTGGLVTRLPRGTKVKVGSTKDGWFQIKFGDGFANEGWVYRGAIGR